MPFTDFAENRFADLTFRQDVATPLPTTWYVGLLVGAPSDSTPGTECSYAGYARTAVAATATQWKGTGGETSGASAGTNGTARNRNELTIGAAPTSGPQTATQLGLYDAASGGNLWAWAALADPKTINAGDPAPTVPVDALGVRVTD